MDFELTIRIADWAVWLVNERRYVFPESGPLPRLYTEHDAFAHACELTVQGSVARAVRYAA